MDDADGVVVVPMALQHTHNVVTIRKRAMVAVAEPTLHCTILEKATQIVRLIYLLHIRDEKDCILIGHT